MGSRNCRPAFWWKDSCFCLSVCFTTEATIKETLSSVRFCPGRTCLVPSIQVTRTNRIYGPRWRRHYNYRLDTFSARVGVPAGLQGALQVWTAPTPVNQQGAQLYWSRRAGSRIERGRERERGRRGEPHLGAASLQTQLGVSPRVEHLSWTGPDRGW